VFLKKNKLLIAGIIIGCLCALPAGVLANATGFVSAFLDGAVTFQFDGKEQALPEGYTVLNYENHTYVPARFVAERLGASVVWDGTHKVVRINTQPCRECVALHKEKQELEKTVKEQEERIKTLEQEIKDLEELAEKEEPSAEGQPVANYQKLPLKRVLTDMNISVTGLVRDDFYTRIYLEVENKKTVPLQLLHTRTTAIVDGEEYKTSDIMHFALDERWYHDIAEEELRDGYIMLPILPEGSKEMLLQLTFLYNDAGQDTTTVEFAIRLDS
jgi:hypothetical protein